MSARREHYAPPKVYGRFLGVDLTARSLFNALAQALGLGALLAACCGLLLAWSAL